MNASRLYYLTRVAAAVAVLLVAGAVQANTITYDLSNSFDAAALPPTANPYNTVWSYGIFANTSLAAAIPSSFVADSSSGVGRLGELVQSDVPQRCGASSTKQRRRTPSLVNSSYYATTPVFVHRRTHRLCFVGPLRARHHRRERHVLGSNAAAADYTGTSHTVSLVWLTSGGVSTQEDSYGSVSGSMYTLIGASNTPPGSTHTYTGSANTRGGGRHRGLRCPGHQPNRDGL